MIIRVVVVTKEMGLCSFDVDDCSRTDECHAFRRSVGVVLIGFQRYRIALIVATKVVQTVDVERWRTIVEVVATSTITATKGRRGNGPSGTLLYCSKHAVDGHLEARSYRHWHFPIRLSLGYGLPDLDSNSDPHLYVRSRKLVSHSYFFKFLSSGPTNSDVLLVATSKTTQVSTPPPIPMPFQQVWVEQ